MEFSLFCSRSQNVAIQNLSRFHSFVVKIINELKREIMKISDETTGQNASWFMLYVANLDLNQIMLHKL